MDKITELVEKLRHFDDIYFNASITDDIIDDNEYDNLRNKLKLLDPSNEYFTGIGSDVRGGKVPLPYPIGSLNQVYDNADIEIWSKKYEVGNDGVVISDKLDGCSCLLIYRKGKFVQAFSRGNGTEGADITRNIKLIPNLPEKINTLQDIAVRSEVIIKKLTFDIKYSKEFKNSRNMVAGILNRKVPTEDVLNDFEIIVYELVDGVKDLNKTQELQLLKDYGFKVVEYQHHDVNILNDEMLSKVLSDRKSKSEYVLDGLVVTAEIYKNIPTQSNSSSLNPEHSVKYKNLSKDAYRQVYVVDVLWELSMNGLWKPRVQIVPTELDGVTITYATGFNGAFIRDNGIGPGAIVEIVRSGSVIPFITKIIKKVEPKMPDDVYIWGSSGIEIMIPDHNNNPNVKFKQVLAFFDTLGVELLKEATLKTMFDKHKLSNLSYDDIIIFLIELLEIEWVKVVGINGKKIFNSLHNKLQKLPPEEFLGALRYFGAGFGVRKAKMLLNQCSGIHSIKNLSEQDIVNMSGFDTITAKMILSGIGEALNLLEKLKDYINLVEKKAVSSDLQNMNVVLTGFRDSTLQNFIEMNGGKVSSGVSKKTTHLICSSLDSSSSKYKKAEELGVKIMTLDDFKNIYL
jgi:NAD-dependent DNA ligase